MIAYVIACLRRAVFLFHVEVDSFLLPFWAWIGWAHFAPRQVSPFPNIACIVYILESTTQNQQDPHTQDQW